MPDHHWYGGDHVKRLQRGREETKDVVLVNEDLVWPFKPPSSA